MRIYNVNNASDVSNESIKCTNSQQQVNSVNTISKDTINSINSINAINDIDAIKCANNSNIDDLNSNNSPHLKLLKDIISKNLIRWEVNKNVLQATVILGYFKNNSGINWSYTVSFVRKEDSNLINFTIKTKQGQIIYNTDIPTLSVRDICNNFLGVKINTFVDKSLPVDKPIGIYDGDKYYKYVRLTKSRQPFSNEKASSVEIYLKNNKKDPNGLIFNILSENKSLESLSQKEQVLSENNGMSDFSYDEATIILKNTINYFKSKGYVDEHDFDYIPEGSNNSNWDFKLNSPKITARNKSKQIHITSQALINNQNNNFSQYFSGEIPDYLSSYIGTSNVEHSRISGFFPNSSKAVDLVNQFDASLLKNISVIFNSSDSGSYGVYVPSLDKAIKTKALKKLLEQKGYEIKEENGMMVAYPKAKEKTTEDINNDIKTLYNQLESHGGTVFGINMQKVIASAKEDAKAIKSPYNNLWELLAILHLGGTITHEAVHAKGSQSEGPSEMGEARFVEWALPKINEEYKRILEGMGKGDEFSPIIIGTQKRHATTNNNWYKLAQSNYFPVSNGMKPSISEITQNKSSFLESGIKDWAMRNRDPKTDNIELKLNRNNMSPLPKDLSQENDSLETQLRKVTRNNFKLNPTLIFEELLRKDHADASTSYKSTEELLKEKRPTPLMKTIKKASLYKVATLFGWMNNLDLSDGYTLGGLGDRVMAWDDRDEDFAWSEKEIRTQPRYNPEYDIAGFYYRWIEPRFTPQLFDDMTKDYTNTAPAKRFAKIEENTKDLSYISYIIKKAVNDILNNEILATRFIGTEEIGKLISKLTGDKLKIKAFVINTEDNQDIYSYWILNESLEDKNIDLIEEAIHNKDLESVKDIANKILNPSTNPINKIVSLAEDICNKHNIDMNIIGSYARCKFLNEKNILLHEISFNGGDIDTNMKFLSLLKKGLKINTNDDLSKGLKYKGVKINCSCDYPPSIILDLMDNNNIDKNDILLADLCNRDFTINMCIYNLKTKNITFPFNKFPSISTIETLFDPLTVVSNNPFVILRAIKLKLQYGLMIDKDLELAMISNAPLLFDGRYNDDGLVIARQEIYGIDKEKAKEAFNEYGIIMIDSI